MQDNNPFDDVAENQRGIFGDDCAGLCPALSNYDTNKKAAQQDGLAMQFDCQRCGSSKIIVVEWPEMLALRAGVPPAVAYQGVSGLMQGPPLDWKWDSQERVWWPNRTCSGCHQALVVALAPEDVQQHVDIARSRALFPPQMEKACAQMCAAAIAALRQQMGR
jgi:hypothetical protein